MYVHTPYLAAIAIDMPNDSPALTHLKAGLILEERVKLTLGITMVRTNQFY